LAFVVVVPSSVGCQHNISSLHSNLHYRYFNSLAMVESDSRSATLADEKDHRRSVSPSPLPSINKEEQPAITADNTDNEGSLKAEEGAAPDDGEYETGMKLALIIVSLLLSIFLVGRVHYLLL
jgi:hypothetical protein